MTWVKICGITRREDALVAAGLGANALGFVFWPGSPRFIDAAAAGAIVRSLPPGVAAVGVFVDQPLEHVEEVARSADLRAVQLHGSETAEYCQRLAVPIIKAVGAGPTFRAAAATLWPSNVMLLLDADDPDRRGGTGAMANWPEAAAVARIRRIVLAGGLTPDTVAEAIRVVRPFGVDVSSGVESRPGVKDTDRMKRFIAAARAAATEVEDDDHAS
jgi:phosphoribosylanthranilate isomerase